MVPMISVIAKKKAGIAPGLLFCFSNKVVDGRVI
jgi:hypothetical protein